MAMRLLTVTTAALLLAACATAPKPATTGEAPVSEHSRGGIVGLTADDLVRQFGTPALQIREGSGLKLQFRSNQCVLDAYLYPAGGDVYRVTYVDSRNRAMADVDQALCIDSLRAP